METNHSKTDKCIYVKKYGFPYLAVDYIEIEKNTEYEVKICCEKKDYERTFFPEIIVPEYLGYIKTKGEAVSMRGKKTHIMQCLVCMVDMSNQEMKIKYMSELGGIQVSFECCYRDERMGETTFDFGERARFTKMLKEAVSGNKNRYICRAPFETERDNLIFTVEWNKVEEAAMEG